ncbi:MAG: leucyl aminopeptidase [Trueperaceae bacterium]
MQTTVLQRPIDRVEADALIVHHFSGGHRAAGATGEVDRALGGLISELAARGDLATDVGGVTPLFVRAGVAAPRVLVVGLGDPQRVDAEAVRRASGAAMRRARELGARRVAIGAMASGLGGLTPSESARATVEGARLGLYRYHAAAARALGGRGDHGVDELLIVVPDADRVEAVSDGVRWGEATADGVELARDLVNLPPNVATPTHLAAVAEQLARDHGFAVTIGDRAWAEERGMGAFLAVAQGAGHEPRFIVLEHDPSRGKEAPLVLVGKGVTFDSGGVSIKGRAGMEAMKSDMAGAAAVLGAMRTLGRLRSPRRVVALVPATENMLDAHAYRPADVLQASNGLTIEVISTDAEGRLLLADTLAYAQQLKPKAVVDLATLTGACVVALGRGTAAGRFANDDALAARVDAAAAATHERVWPLPLWPEYLDDLESDVADMKNSSGKPHGGAPVAAAFLQRFVDYPWVHLDIAGMALRDDARGYHTKGATGYGVRLLVHWVTHA